MARSRQRDRGARGGRGSGGGGLGSQEAAIYLATAATLIVAAAVILVGLYLTRYRPPRAHVLTVQDERYDASDVVARGAYLITYQAQPSSAGRLAQDTVDTLTHEALFRIAGPTLVGEVTDTDIENGIRVLLGFPTIGDSPDAAADGEVGATGTPAAGATTAASTPPATATIAATATATAAATGTAAAEAPDDRAEFAQAYQDYLRSIKLGRKEFEEIIRADVIKQRLRKQFGESIGEGGPQKRISRIRVNDFALAEAIHQQLVDGEDFAKLHGEHSTGEESGEGGDLGWAALEALPESTADAVRELGPGEFSDVVTSGLEYDIFMVTEVSEDQPYDPDTKDALIDNAVDEWLATEQSRITVEQDLSDGEETWINERILSRAQDIVTAATAQQQ